MLLHDALDEAVAEVSADLPALVAAASREGRSLRRHRRARTTAGAVVATVVVAGGAWALLPGGDPESARDPGITAAPQTASGPLSGRTAPATGRAAAAALVAAVDRVADGTFTRVGGQDPDRGGSAASFQFEPASAGVATDVFLNLQRIPRDEDPASVTCGGDYANRADCTVTLLPGGDVLRTYVDDDSGAGVYRRNVAEVRSAARGLRVIVGSSNTRDGDTGLRGVEPALTVDQLTEVVTQPWWGLRRLPVEYVEAGERLPSYGDHLEG